MTPQSWNLASNRNLVHQRSSPPGRRLVSESRGIVPIVSRTLKVSWRLGPMLARREEKEC